MDSQGSSANRVHENGDYHDSAETSPEGTVTSSLRRVESQETLMSSDSTQVGSEHSFQHPAPPPNSVVSDLNDLSLAYIDTQLSNVPGATTAPTPAAESAGPAVVEGKAHLRARVRGDVPLLQQLFKRPPNVAKRVRRVTKKALTGATITRTEVEDHDHIEHVHEGSTWVHLAMEDVSRGLERLAMAAKDLNKIESGKTVEEHYNEKLAEVLKAAEIKFDPKFLE